MTCDGTIIGRMAESLKFLSYIEYVPMYWGPRYKYKWDAQKGGLYSNPPRHLMAFNEPDVSSQANMDANYAADLYMQEIQPFARRGTRLGSPAIVFNDDWMDTFLKSVSSKGGRVDFICIHWYGSWDDLDGFKQWVTKVHNRFHKNIWITEMGITTASGPTQTRVKNFMLSAIGWLNTQGYVERYAWFGAFETSKPPDGYATGLNALLSPGGQLNELGSLYINSGPPAPKSTSKPPPKPTPKTTSRVAASSAATSSAAKSSPKCKRHSRRRGARSHHRHPARSLPHPFHRSSELEAIE